MNINTIAVPPLGTNCYIISDSGESACIDPGGDPSGILSLVEGNLRFIILTHGHFDHIGAVSEIKAKTGAEILIHPLDAPMLSDSRKSLAAAFGFKPSSASYDRLINDGDEIKVGTVKLSVLHTPGHSEGSVSLYTEGVLFSGDTLFKSTVGRFERKDKEVMQNSIKCLLSLPDDTKVYPGHEASTTIAFEKENNPFGKFDWVWE